MFEVAKNAKYAVNKKIIANKTIWWIVEMGDGGSWEGHQGQKYLPIVVFLAWPAWATHFAMSQ